MWKITYGLEGIQFDFYSNSTLKCPWLGNIQLLALMEICCRGPFHFWSTLCYWRIWAEHRFAESRNCFPSSVLCSSPSHINICMVHCIMLLFLMPLLTLPFLIYSDSSSFSPSLIPYFSSLSFCRFLPLIHSEWSMPLIKCARHNLPDGVWPRKPGHDLQLSTTPGYVMSFQSHIVTCHLLKILT